MEKRTPPFGVSNSPNWVAPWASLPEQSLGRLFSESPSPTRSGFQRDRDRIIHSTAFRRLAHKTQVFVPHEGDHFRTRLTHTIEVSQIARALSRSLGLNSDLAEALALAHDLGHTCFGHTGEDVLDRLMAGSGGFDHNAQALRVVTRLERRYARYDGLNLTWETLEGLVKHNGPLLTPEQTPVAKYIEKGIPVAILEFDRQWALQLSNYASAEAQAAAIADDIAYNAHDVDDGLRAGLFEIDDLAELAFVRQIVDEIQHLHPGLEIARQIHEIVRRVITLLVEDVVAASLSGLEQATVNSAADVRHAGRTLVTFSSAMARHESELKTFLFDRMYRHPRVMSVREEAVGVVERLFSHFRRHSQDMPAEWSSRASQVQGDDPRRMRLVCDYIAGMTDRYALAEHQRVFGRAPSLR